MTHSAYEEKKQRLVAFLQSNPGATRLDVRDFNNVLHVDPVQGYADAEGMTPYAKLVAECLKHGVMPTVVPQLKSITLGGATVGCGIEATSFKYGLVHETV